MSQAKPLLVLAVIAVAALLLLWSASGEVVQTSPGTSTDGTQDVESVSADLATAEVSAIEADHVVTREAVAGPDAATGVRGRIIDAKTREPLAGVEVLAMRRPPGFEQLFARMRTTMFEGKGLWAETVPEPEILGRATTGSNGEFEILGLPPGVVFLDGRSDFTFVRTPERTRLARGEIREGIELVGSPGGRVRGLVIGPGGLPASGVAVTLRPGLNAFLGQVTERQYRWLVASTDADGEYDIPGVPAGHGYTLSAAGPLIALAEQHGVDVEVGKVTRVDVQGYAGATIEGRVLDVDGVPRADALVAMAYLDVSRVLFSADGRGEPIHTDAKGRFRLDRVASGRVAFIATADGRANSGIEELAIVDGGEYHDLELVLREGIDFGGLVVDGDGRPLAGATVDIRPMEQPNSPDVLKTLLNIRSVQVETGIDGRFQTSDLTAKRVFLQTSKPGYVTEIKFRHDVEEEDDVRIELVRGVTIKGRVVDASGQPVERFRVDTRSRPVSAEDDEEEAGDDEGFGRPPRSERRNWRRGGSMRIGEGRKIGDRGFDGNWREFRAADGAFEITGVPPGNVRVRVRAEGYLDPDNQNVTLAAGEQSDELRFALAAGCVARGKVVDATSGAPVPDVDVTAYEDRERAGNGIFQLNFDQQDVDFLGMATKNSAKTASDGTFEITGLSEGAHRFTARHPDRAKSSVKAVEVTAAQPTEGIVIEIETGGGIRGLVTGRAGKPLPDALIVAFSMAAGSFKSSSTDKNGEYEIDGLPPGQYAVFKSKIGERAMNLGYDLLGNMRLKTVRVRKNEFTDFDIQDESENTVRVWGVVRDGDQPVAEGMVSALSTDSEGFFGMGLRAQPTDKDGRYELIGLEPGEYFFQVSRFRGRPQQASLSIEIPEGVHDFRVDLDLPQSAIRGRVVDTRGEPVAGIRVSAGVQSGGLDDAPGLLGVIMKNGIAQDRTDENGEFEIDKVAAGVYRLSVSGRQGRRAHRKYGEASVEDVVIDGSLPVEGIVLTLPLAGRVTGVVVDGSGSPVAGAEIHYEREDVRPRSDPTEEMLDLLGMQVRPEKSGPDGRFELTGLSPGTYRVRADADGLAPGVAEDVLVAEESVVDVSIQVV
ncbi:MAG: carboxypeptidase regulatory-like domain-containing protein, partial [Planctomycetes bacterium]|nr:carboxypeptidase regulatory-like domain-containing protein [Planctomycetota bacterium]